MNDMEDIKTDSNGHDVRPDVREDVRSNTRQDVRLDSGQEVRYDVGQYVRAEDVCHPLRMGKSERLHHSTLVEGLFAEGKSMYEFPLRMVWRWMPAETLDASFRNGRPAGIAPVQMMVTIPKKKRRHAVDRVLMRRRIREAYRLNRMPMREALAQLPADGFLQLAFIYLHNENAEYAELEPKMQKLLAKLTNKLCRHC
jgi:ribonuclease P protein component